MKIPLTPAGIEPATFRFVAQHLNHFATAVRQCSDGTGVYFPAVKQMGRECNHSIPRNQSLRTSGAMPLLSIRLHDVNSHSFT